MPRCGRAAPHRCGSQQDLGGLACHQSQPCVHNAWTWGGPRPDKPAPAHKSYQWRARWTGSFPRPPQPQRVFGLHDSDLLAEKFDLHGLLADLLIEALVFCLLRRRAFFKTLSATGQKCTSPLREYGRRHAEFPTERIDVFATQEPENRLGLMLRGFDNRKLIRERRL